MSTTLSLSLSNGTTASAELVLPPGNDPAGSLVIVHEWWGLNDDIRRLAGRFAAEGLLACAVDLYGGRSTTDASEALGLSSELDTRHAVEVVRAAREALLAHPRSNGKVGVTGFCLGGAMTLAAACNVPGLDAALPFYGTPKDQYLELSGVKARIQGHYAKVDPFVSFERVTSIVDKARAAGVSFELFAYDAGHAFMREGDPNAYHEPSATLAWQRATAFLRETLG